MNSIERFMNTVERKPVDRPACWLGMPDIKAQPALMEEFGVTNMHDLKLAIGDDVYTVQALSMQHLTGIRMGMWMQKRGL